MAVTTPRTIVIEDPDAPVTCPPLHARWNLHPRVYLTRKPGDREIICPYCSTLYVLPEPKPQAKEAGSS